MAYTNAIFVKIPEYQKQELKQFAEKNGLSIAEVIRRAIDEYILNHDSVGG